MIGDKCDKINPIFKYLEEIKVIDLHGDSKCFDVKTTLLLGCWVNL